MHFPMTRSAPETRRDDGEGAAALPFIEAVARQCAAAREGDDAVRRARIQRAIARRVSRLVGSAVRVHGMSGGTDPSAVSLARDPVLLSSFFQNIDLLYAHGYRHADRVSGQIMRAVELLDHPEPESA